MIVQKNFINKLKDFGLNSYESKLWTALLSRGISTAGELSDIANVPRSRSYDVLESLEKKGFIILKVGKPIKYIAVPPDEVLIRVKRKIQEDADQRTELMEQLESSEILHELSQLHTQGVVHIDPGDLAGSFKGRKNLYNHIAAQIKSAKKSVTILTTATGILRKADHFSTLLTKAKERGVKVRIAAPFTKDAQKIMAKLGKVAELRHSPLQTRMVMVDDQEITFMLLDDQKIQPAYDVGIWVKSPYFVEAMQGLVLEQWKNFKAPDK